MSDSIKLDIVGDWSVSKLEILKAYLGQYATILGHQKTKAYGPNHFGYIDGFAGAGVHLSKDTGKMIDGSPMCALTSTVPFDSYHFVDMNLERVEGLRFMAENSKRNATVHHGDCNDILLKTIFPQYPRDKYKRALCFLDPYGVNLDWKVMETAGQMGSIEIFLNFPIMDMNRNGKRSSLIDSIDHDVRKRMTRFWGDESWHSSIFRKEPSLFEEFDFVEKTTNDDLAHAFRQRLKEVAGFKFVPEPVAMKNKSGATVYYLFWAGPNETGSRIASHILKKYRTQSQ